MPEAILHRLNYPHLGMLVLSWFLALLVMPWCIALANRVGLLDRPHTYKTHREPVAYLGGVGICVAFSVTVLASLRLTPVTQALSSYGSFIDFVWSTAGGPLDHYRSLFGIVGGGVVVCIVGTIDALRPLNAVVKLVSLLLATLILSFFGVTLNLLPHVPGNALNVGLTLLWVAGLSSAMNSLDNADGAAGGVSAIAAATIFVIAWYSNRWEPRITPWLSWAALALLGSCLGFLRFNRRPARIFLGDAGSLFLGFTLASLTTLGGWSQNDPLRSLIVPCLICAVPLYDITLATILRLRHGVVRGLVGAIVYCGQDHVYHRLVALGYSPAGAVRAIHAGAIGSSLVAGIIALAPLSRPAYLGIALAYVVVLVALAVRLDRAPVYAAESSAPPAPAPSPVPS